MRTSATCAIVLSALLAACTTSGDATMCRDVQCRPPTCCGGSCSSSADCCAETICSTTGRCIPARCAGCGELGCLVDYDACTAECAPPASCGEACGSDADCATGTTCTASVAGDMRCYPDSCGSCGGLTPLCQIAGSCSVTCVAPARCGEACEPGADCGAGAICHTFASTGASYCVPRDFADECSFCGSDGCTFHPSSCDVTCQDPAPVDAGTSPGRDAGTSPGRDGGVPPIGADGGGGTTPPTGPSCLACCSPCTADSDCCAGSACLQRADTGERMCFPSECRFCTYGCTYYCP